MRYCPNCNFAIENDKAKFCKKCGTKLPLSVSPSQLESSRQPEALTHSQPPFKSNLQEKNLSRTTLPPINMQRDDSNKTVSIKKESEREYSKRRKIGMIGSVIKCFKNYVCFRGRATRSEYWYFYLFNTIIFFALWGAAIAIAKSPTSDILTGGALAYLCATICPQFAAMVRRLHDIGKSGWFWVVTFIPLVGGIILIVFLSKKGTPGENIYGPPVTY